MWVTNGLGCTGARPARPRWPRTGCPGSSWRWLGAGPRRGGGDHGGTGRVHRPFGREALTAAFYLLADSGRNKRDRRGAAQITFAFGKLSGAALLIGLLIGLLLLAASSHSLLLASFAHVPGGAGRTAAQVLLLGGFAVKAGLVPFQVWLPRGYAAARGPARAIMAGVCVNVAFYGMWRTPAVLGRAPGILVGAVLVLGALTALLGIAHAAVQNRLSRVIAYSSIENTGLIVTGFGIALTRGGGRGPAAGRGRPAGRHTADSHAHGGQVAAVHLGRRDRGSSGQ